MTRSIFFYASLAFNVLLLLTIVNIYQSDVFFRAWVQQSIGPQYPILVLTLAIGGGSGLGYLLLQRKRPTKGVSPTKLVKSRIPKPGIIASPSPSIVQARNPMSPGPSTAGQIPRQVAYAVPPALTSKSGSSKSVPSTVAWSQPTKPAPILSTPQSQPPIVQRETQVPTQPLTSIPPSMPMKIQQTSPAQPFQKQTPGQIQWRPTEAPSSQLPYERKSPEQGIQGGRAGFDVPPRSPIPGSSPTQPLPSKWAPIPQTSPQQFQPNAPSQNISTEPIQKWAPTRSPQQGPLPPTVVTAPSGITPQPPRPSSPTPVPGFAGQSKPPAIPTGPQAQQQARPSPSTFMARPVPGPAPRPYPPFSGPQGPGPTAPSGNLGPVGVMRPPQPVPRPLAPTQQWRTPPPSKPPPSSEVQPAGSIPRPEQPKVTQTAPSPITNQKEQEQNASGSSSSPAGSGPPAGSDMDWDTALDTILKTLRRDRIRDEQ